jgi:transcription antitermination factor NusA-like protein
LEVPEIHNGIVELKGVAREPGYRSKVAVAARQEGIDPVGSCVGLRGVRIQNIVSELGGERIDVIQWDAHINTFVANALSPAQVVSVEVDDGESTATVVVPDGQLSLAIGKEGQNARLAARLTGYKIDIKAASVAKADKLAQAEALPAKAPVAGEPKAAPHVRAEHYEMPLESLGLSTRTFNFLSANGVNSVGDLMAKSDDELLGLRNFGKKSLAEVKEKLGALEPVPGAPTEVEVREPTIEEELPAEEALEVPQVGELEEVVVEEEEEEEDVVIYVPPEEEAVPADKPAIRFAEDIFAAQPSRGEGKKRGKKKAHKDESEGVAAKRKRRAAHEAAPTPEFEDLMDE